jgi:hypothetical protein
VECCTQAELDASHLEEVAPHVAGEDRVAVADDGRGEVVKTNDAVEEGTSDRGSLARVDEGDELCVLGEAVDDGEDHGLPVDLG